jgi:hypothetical protein
MFFVVKLCKNGKAMSTVLEPGFTAELISEILAVNSPLIRLTSETAEYNQRREKHSVVHVIVKFIAY